MWTLCSGSAALLTHHRRLREAQVYMKAGYRVSQVNTEQIVWVESLDTGGR